MGQWEGRRAFGTISEWLGAGRKECGGGGQSGDGNRLKVFVCVPAALTLRIMGGVRVPYTRAAPSFSPPFIPPYVAYPKGEGIITISCMAPPPPLP